MRWHPDMVLIVYCGDRLCGASKAVADRLTDEAGINGVRILEGGWVAWQNAEAP